MLVYVCLCAALIQHEYICIIIEVNMQDLHVADCINHGRIKHLSCKRVL